MSKSWAMQDLQNRVRELPLSNGNQMNILTYMALRSNPDGSNCFPSVASISKATRLNSRVVQYEMRRLEVAGWITCVANEVGGKGKPRVYKLNIPAGKGQQMSLKIDQPKGETEDTLSNPKGVNLDAQRVKTKAPKGEKSDVPIRSTLNYPIGSLPGEETEKLPEQISPEDFPSISLAQKVSVELCLQREVGMLDAVASAIDFCVKFEGKTKSSATEYLIARARDEIDHGGTPNRFWFTDRKWRPGNGNGKQHQNGNDKAGTRAAVAAGVERFMQLTNGMGDKHVSATVAAKSRNSG